MKSKTVPSATQMKNLNSMIKTHGVKYYSSSTKNNCYARLGQEKRSKSDVVDYIKYYELTPYNTLSTKQCEELAEYFWDNYRTFFGREYDRIICTNSFRRLQYKTQVMVNSTSDEQRTRLLHSLEVQRIAKKIALGIGANAELAENIAVAHDIGHAPFGHSGEEAISEYMLDMFKKGNAHIKDGDACFLHAMQSVKVLDKIATHKKLQEYNIDGLGLSDYVLEGVLKHDSDVFSENITSEFLSKQYDVKRLCGIIGIGDHDQVSQLLDSNVTKYKHIPEMFIGSIEAQIVAWADKIAYLGHDWEEFLDTKLLEKLMSRINDMVHKMFDINNSLIVCNNISEDEHNLISNICDSFKGIETLYAQSISKSTSRKQRWDNVRKYVKNIIEALENNKKFDGFTEKEYCALKDYLAMVMSWSKLINNYPEPQAMKYDPIYIFYIYLSNVRTTIITKTVTDALIYGSTEIINTLTFTDRKGYLLHCNNEWVRIYNEIYDASDFTGSDKDIIKNRKKQLKDSVRSCYLVQFGIEDAGGNIKYEPKRVKVKNGYYNFDDRYGCLLNIIKCINSQYIGSTRVNFMTQQAKKIVKELLEYYTNHPNMLPYSQRKKFRRDKTIKEITEDFGALYCIADYIGGMTDRMAKKKYDEITSSDTKWSNEYSSGLN